MSLIDLKLKRAKLERQLLENPDSLEIKQKIDALTARITQGLTTEEAYLNIGNVSLLKANQTIDGFSADAPDDQEVEEVGDVDEFLG